MLMKMDACNKMPPFMKNVSAKQHMDLHIEFHPAHD